MAADWVDYLDSLAAFGMRPGLERVAALLADLGHPERRFRTIHVVGTNGKSSTTRYAAAVLSAHGLRSGAYLSPHITGYPERVLIDGAPIADDAFGAAVQDVRRHVTALPPELGETTQFEVLTVASFLAMAAAGVEAAAVEAGLGGRLDASNVLHAPVVVLTNIGLEHTEVLGGTRELIFAEKAAVIAGGDAVFGDLEGLEPLAAARCAAVDARPHFLGRQIVLRGRPEDFSVSLDEGDRSAIYDRLAVATPAHYQVANAGLAVAAAHFLLGDLEVGPVRRGLLSVVVPGRLQIVRRDPLVVADGAHNPHGTAALAASLDGMEMPRPRVGLLAMLADKDVDGMLRTLLPRLDTVICTRTSEPRGLGAGELAGRVRRMCAEYKVTAEAGTTEHASAILSAAVSVVDEPLTAYAAALRAAGAGGSVLVTGSLYLLEDLAAELAGARR